MMEMWDSFVHIKFCRKVQNVDSNSHARNEKVQTEHSPADSARSGGQVSKKWGHPRERQPSTLDATKDITVV